jgi:hypothetical protein
MNKLTRLFLRFRATMPISTSIKSILGIKIHWSIEGRRRRVTISGILAVDGHKVDKQHVGHSDSVDQRRSLSYLYTCLIYYAAVLLHCEGPIPWSC